MALDLEQRNYLQATWYDGRRAGLTDKFLIKRYFHSNKRNVGYKPPRLVQIHSKEEEVFEGQLQQSRTRAK